MRQTDRPALLVIVLIALMAFAVPVLAAESPSPSVSPSASASDEPSASVGASESPAESAESVAPSESASPAESASPTESAAPAESEEPAESAKPDKPDKPDKADKGPEIAKTLRGTVARTLDGKGRPTYTVTVAGVAWELSAGPKWYWGDAGPLAALVGTTVTVTGTYHAGGTDLDVETVNGKAIRAAGKPPWAGGPKVQGDKHPGWKSWKAEFWKDKAAARAAREKAKAERRAAAASPAP